MPWNEMGYAINLGTVQREARVGESAVDDANHRDDQDERTG
jgi:hypothetical protein